MRVKPLRLPPKDLSQLRLKSTTLSEGPWLRLHFPGRALRFSKNPEHRFTPNAARYAVLYLAQDEETAALEIYGDRLYGRKQGRIAKTDWEARQISSLALPALEVADLTYRAMITARVDLAALAHRSRNVTHQWGRAVVHHAKGFHGLLFLSRFTGRTCLALFEIQGDPAPTLDGTQKRFADLPVAHRLLREFSVALT